jgi:hypothetical protein
MAVAKQVEYHYDAARAARARNYYNNLMINKPRFYGEEEQIQLLAAKVGGLIC